MATKLVKPYSDFGSLKAALCVFDKKNFNHKVFYGDSTCNIFVRFLGLYCIGSIILILIICALFIVYFLFFGHTIVF